MTSLTEEERRLVRRYLLWCYKTTREGLDKVDRYYTQEIVDQFVLDYLRKGDDADQYRERIDAFADYIREKVHRADQKKFVSAEQKEALKEDYAYQKRRLRGIEEAIVYFLGKETMEEIVTLYEQEMTRRILAAEGRH